MKLNIQMFGGRGATSGGNKLIAEWKQAERNAVEQSKGTFKMTGDQLRNNYSKVMEKRGIATDKFYKMIQKENTNSSNKESKLLKFNDTQKSVSYTNNNTRISLLNGYGGEKAGGQITVRVENVAPYHFNDIIRQKQFTNPKTALNYTYTEIKKIRR